MFWIIFILFPRLTLLVTYLIGSMQEIFPNETPFLVDVIGAIFAPLGWAAYQLWKAGYPDWAVIGLCVLQVIGWLSGGASSSRRSKS